MTSLHSFIDVLSVAASTLQVRVEKPEQRPSMACKAYRVYSPALYRKSVPTTALEQEYNGTEGPLPLSMSWACVETRRNVFGLTERLWNWWAAPQGRVRSKLKGSDLGPRMHMLSWKPGLVQNLPGSHCR